MDFFSWKDYSYFFQIPSHLNLNHLLYWYGSFYNVCYLKLLLEVTIHCFQYCRVWWYYMGYTNNKILSIWTYIFNKATNLPRTCCELQEFTDAIHLVHDKYTELAGCSSLLHARHKGLAGIVMTRGMASFQSACELFNKFNKGSESTSKSLCPLSVELWMKYLVLYHLWKSNRQRCTYIIIESKSRWRID